MTRGQNDDLFTRPGTASRDAWKGKLGIVQCARVPAKETF